MADSPRILELRRRVQADPASIAFAQLAEECRRLGSNEEAAEICRAGLARHPGYLSARVTLGRALIELGQLDAAKAELEIVVAGVPDNLAAIRGLAEILQRRGQMPEALQYYKRALDLAKHDRDLEDTVERISQEVAPAPAPQIAGPQASIEEIFNFDKLIDQLGLPPEESASAPPASEGRQAAVLEDIFTVESPASEGEAEAPMMLESVELPASEGGSAFAAEGRFGVTAPELAQETAASEGGPEVSLEDFFAEIPVAPSPEPPVMLAPPEPEVEASSAFASASPKLADETPASEGGSEGSFGGQDAVPEDFFAVESPASEVAPGVLESVELTLDDADSLAVMERELRELEQQRAADERSARVELAQRRRAAMVFALETWLSAIVADRERTASA